MDSKRKRQRKLLSSLCALSTIISLTSCSMLKEAQDRLHPDKPTTTTETTKQTFTPTPEPEVSSTPTETTAPSSKEEALAIAKENGIPEEYLRGEYELFVKFSRTIDGNKKLGNYTRFIYYLFPVIADHITDEGYEFFFAKLGSLRIDEKYQGLGLGGTYNTSDNLVTMNLDYQDSDRFCYDAVALHELFHFIDSTIDGPIEQLVLTTDEFYPISEASGDNNDRSAKVTKARFLTEGFAELYCEKYFTRINSAYQVPVQFLTGLEYLIGSEKLDELFIRKDSAYGMALLMEEEGFTKEEIYYFFQTMDYMTNGKAKPSYCLRPEDALIRMYGNHKSGDFKEDPLFCHILRCISGDDYFPFSSLASSYEDFLTENLWSQSAAITWCGSVLSQIPGLPALDLYDTPLLGIFIDGEYTLIGRVTLEPGTENELKDQYVAVHYDFSTGKITSFDVGYISPFKRVDTAAITDDNTDS